MQPCSRSARNPEQLVAGASAERVVDAPEIVETEVEHGQLLAARHVGERLRQSLAQQEAVGQVCQGVVAGHVGDLHFGLPPLGDILVGRYPAASGHRMVQDRDRAAVGQFDELADALALRDVRRELFDVIVGIAGVGAVLLAAVEQLSNGFSGLNELRRQAVHVVVVLIADHEPARRVEHQEGLRHVADGGVEAHVLGLELRFPFAQFARALLHQVLELPIEPVELLHHQRHGTIGKPSIALGLLIGRADEVAQPAKVDLAGRRARLHELSAEQLVHRLHPGFGAARQPAGLLPGSSSIRMLFHQSRVLLLGSRHYLLMRV